MNLGKQLKIETINKFNKVVLPLMDFKVRVTDRYFDKFSGHVKMNKLKLYKPNSNWNDLFLIVDVTISGYCVIRKSYREEHEIINLLNNNYPLSISSQISFTGDYEKSSKSFKCKITSLVKNSIIESISDYVDTMSLKSVIKNIGNIKNISIGKITYK